MKRTPLPQVTDCTGCGACCTEQAALPVHLVGDYFHLDSVTPLPEPLKAELRETVERFKRHGFPPDGSPCIWYDHETRRCRHYEHRPTLCRDEVQPGDESCLLWRRRKVIDKVPGYAIRGGRLVRT